jgi:hypothetical protein
MQAFTIYDIEEEYCSNTAARVKTPSSPMGGHCPFASDSMLKLQ